MPHINPVTTILIPKIFCILNKLISLAIDSLFLNLQDDWSKMAFCGAAVPTLCLLFAIFCLPESEIWLKSNSPNKPNSPKHSFRELLKTYRTRPEVYKPMYIMNALLILRQLSGTSVLMSYAVSIWNYFYYNNLSLLRLFFRKKKLSQQILMLTIILLHGLLNAGKFFAGL